MAPGGTSSRRPPREPLEASAVSGIVGRPQREGSDRSASVRPVAAITAGQWREGMALGLAPFAHRLGAHAGEVGRRLGAAQPVDDAVHGRRHGGAIYGK